MSEQEHFPGHILNETRPLTETDVRRIVREELAARQQSSFKQEWLGPRADNHNEREKTIAELTKQLQESLVRSGQVILT